MIVDDLSPDGSIEICKTFCDPRIKIIHHSENRGLAAARNTGIRHANGQWLAFLDSDDCWHKDKLQKHFNHLIENPQIGISFSRSAFIDEEGKHNLCYQMPQLSNITPGYCLCRNPIGNGSAPVIRRQVFKDIAFVNEQFGHTMECYFDESLRRSEDIECWIRIMLKTKWVVEGIPEPLTLYRLNSGGLSASLYKQLESWEQVIKKTRTYSPDFVTRWERTARSFQLRYLARQAIRLHDGATATRLINKALITDYRIATREPGRTLLTIAAAYTLVLSPKRLYQVCESIAQRCLGLVQGHKISRDLTSR